MYSAHICPSLYFFIQLFVCVSSPADSFHFLCNIFADMSISAITALNLLDNHFISDMKDNFSWEIEHLIVL